MAAAAAELTPARQEFKQEIAHRFTERDGLPKGRPQLVQCSAAGEPRVFIAGKWYRWSQGRWAGIDTANVARADEFVFFDGTDHGVKVDIPASEVRQVVSAATTTYIATSREVHRVENGKVSEPGSRRNGAVNQIAIGPGGMLYVAASDGLFRLVNGDWQRIEVQDQSGRAWAVRDVRGVALDSEGGFWFATTAGVGRNFENAWRFYEPKDGLPWNDFTGITPGIGGEIWFGTHLGVIRFDGSVWQYRQGPLWLPGDDVTVAAVDRQGTAWFATDAGLGSLELRPMSLADKAELYEDQIQRYIKRTPYGFVAEAPLHRPGDLSSADPQDSDNDGLWTAMYGAGECFAFAATGEARSQKRAQQAFEALRFLQKVTQGSSPAPPKGYIARSIRPRDWPDPNAGRLESDRRDQQHDHLWKIYEPRWPKSADGQWFWKSDTSSDELDGHFFFYPLYYDLCANSDAERERVREVVRDVTDHLLEHGFALIDHDGKPTRWAVYGPQTLNFDPNRWEERGLNSLSILCYLSVAAHITGQSKYQEAARELIEHHGYAINIMYPKAQQGPGSGNQSDDEMAFMCYYGLLRCSHDESLKSLVRYSFFRYWVNEAPEMNPFFNFAYAAHNLQATIQTPWGGGSLAPWKDWLNDSMATLYGFPLDRLNWPHRNSHRLDVLPLPAVASSDLSAPDRIRSRGYILNGKVLPVQNRHFNHWNTDPWQLDYGGNGQELAAGTVFLLPYYMGLYHGFIEKPGK